MTGPRIERCQSCGGWIMPSRGCSACGTAPAARTPRQDRTQSAAQAAAEAQAHRGVLAATVAEIDRQRRPSGKA
jgi:hypothetical protein